MKNESIYSQRSGAGEVVVISRRDSAEVLESESGTSFPQSSIRSVGNFDLQISSLFDLVHLFTLLFHYHLLVVTMH